MRKKSEEDNRFNTILEEVNEDSSTVRLLEDTATGIIYLYYSTLNGAGITTLLDEEGQPAIAEVTNN